MTSSNQDNTMESLIHSERWDDVVRYLETNEGREEMIGLKRDNNYRPLHQVLKQSHCPPLEVIEAILKIFPNEPAEINEDGITALQYAIAFDEVIDGESGRSMRYSLNVFRGEAFHLPVSHIQAMLNACPQSASMTYQDNNRRGNNRLCWTIHLAMLYDVSKCGDLIQALLNADPSIARPQRHDSSSSSSTDASYLPLSAACSMGNEVAIQLLLDAYPEAAAFQQENSSCRSGSYLLHELAVRNVQPIVAKRLIEAHPKALLSPALDQYKRLPLHIACNHVQGDTITTLLEANPSTASVSDVDGNLPLHLALMQKPFLRMFSRLHGDAMKQLLESYPKSVLHTNHLGQLPLHLLHLLINERTLLHSDANITYVMEEQEEAVNDLSDEQIVLQKDKLFQKHSWLHLLVGTYRQLWKSHGSSCSSIGHEYDLPCGATTNDDEEIEPNMWHVIASIGHLMEMTTFDNLLCKLTKKLSIGTHYDVKALDSNDNTMLHLSCHSPFFAAKVMTHQRNSFPEHLTLASRFENDAHGGLGNNNDCENENDVANDLGQKRSNLAVLLKYIERPVACQMARRYNRDGNLPLHVLLMQPCGRTLPCYPNPANNNHTNNSQKKCCKFFDMSHLIDLYPASILEGQGCSFVMPFMVAASSCAHSCTTNAQEAEECCLQCLSCTFVLLRNGGMEQFHS